LEKQKDLERKAGPTEGTESSIILGKLSGYLARYHHNKIRIRSRNIASGVPILPELIEFDNYKFWTLNLWEPEFKLTHGIALNNIIRINGKKITELVEEGKNAPETAKSLLEQAQLLKGQIDSASDLLEKLNG